jgi:Amt family ammonium transporter
MTGIFAKDFGLTSGQISTFLAHLAALAIVSVFSFVGSFILYKVTDLIIPMRVPEDQEIEGLDLSQHGETAIAAELLLAPSTNGNGIHAPMERELVLS